MRTTAIMNMKGGVGKTTTVINLGALLAKEHGARVLMIDADCQRNLSRFFGVVNPMSSLTDLLRQPKLTKVKNLICPTSLENLDMIPAEDSLMDLDLTAVSIGKASHTAIRDALDTVRKDYDYCLIDCPPAFNAAGAAALVAATDVVIPIKLDAFSLDGLGNVTRQIKNMRKLNAALNIAGVLPTMYYKAEQTIEAREVLSNCGYHVYPEIRRSDKVDSMTFDQTPLCVHSPKSASAVDYRKFVNAYAMEGR